MNSFNNFCYTIRTYVRPGNLYVLLMLATCSISCKKFVTLDAPATGISSANAFSDETTAAAVLNGIYTDICAGDNFTSITRASIAGISIHPGSSSDELSLWTGATNSILQAYYKNNLRVITGGVTHLWTKLYYTVYLANFSVEGLSASQNISASVRNQLMGEALFIRAFCYFYLTNLYGDVPLSLTTNYEVSALLHRSPVADIYKQIKSDLQMASGLLRTDYLDVNARAISSERVRPNRAAAQALLARVYLYTEDYVKAELYADTILSNKVVYDTVPLNNVFLKNSQETIWQLPSLGTSTSQNTGQGRLFILPSSGPSSTRPYYLGQNLINAFEAGDQRKVSWTKQVTVGGKPYIYAYKYKIGAVNTPPAEYLMVLRVGELYLVRAEARLFNNKLTDAVADVNVLRKRAGLLPSTVNTKEDIAKLILHERQVELFTEWAHRWFDLKRTKNIDAVMSVVTPQKGGTWDARWALYPVPASEIQRDLNLSQNPGYEN